MTNLHETHETPVLKSYLLGFVLSVLLTLVAYFIVVEHLFSKSAIYLAIILVALLQAWAQIVFFLHLKVEEQSRWKLLTFLFMLLIAFCVVFGTIWIMDNLNYNLMNTQGTST